MNKKMKNEIIPGKKFVQAMRIMFMLTFLIMGISDIMFNQNYLIAIFLFPLVILIGYLFYADTKKVDKSE